MRRAFLHVDEFGKTGMSYLPYAACVSEPLVVWAPSASLLLATDQAFLKPKDLLWLVDRANAPIRIIARENWLCDKTFRKSHPWEHARWVEEFDSVISKLAIEDCDKPLPSRRVIMVKGRQKGFHDADEILTSKSGTTITSKLNRLFARKLLPPGILEKAARARRLRESVPRAILRDVYNHSRAVVSAGAQLAITPSEHMAVLQRIVPNCILPGMTDPELPGSGDVSPADLKEAISVLKRVKPVMSIGELRGFLKSGLKTDLHELIYSSRSQANLDHHLVRQVSEATNVRPLFKRLFNPQDPIDLTLTTGGLVLALATLLLTQRPQFSLISVAIRAIKSPLIRHNLIPEAIQPGHKARSLFFFCFGTTRPKRRQINDLISHLSNREEDRDI